MPKRKVERGQKSEAIRQLLKQNPRMPVKEIVSTLAVRGLKVNPNLVYGLKTKTKARHRKQGVQGGRNVGKTNPAQLVLRVKELAAEAGGMEHLKELVEVLAE
jgi:hypothetical protein